MCVEDYLSVVASLSANNKYAEKTVKLHIMMCWVAAGVVFKIETFDLDVNKPAHFSVANVSRVTEQKSAIYFVLLTDLHMSMNQICELTFNQ